MFIIGEFNKLMNQKMTIYLKEDLSLFDFATNKKDKKIKISRMPTDNP